MSYGVGCRSGSDLALLWLWCRPAAAVQIQFLAWELPFAIGAALKRQKEKERERERKRKKGRKEGKKGIQGGQKSL